LRTTTPDSPGARSTSGNVNSSPAANRTSFRFRLACEMFRTSTNSKSSLSVKGAPAACGL
jgi:hypothetical protein